MSVEPDPGAFRPPRFEVLAEDEPGGVVLRVSGELDLVSEPRLDGRPRADRRPAGTDRPHETRFMDSTGLRALLGAARTYPGLTLSGPLEPPVLRLLELTQTLAILPFDEN